MDVSIDEIAFPYMICTKENSTY